MQRPGVQPISALSGRFWKYSCRSTGGGCPSPQAELHASAVWQVPERNCLANGASAETTSDGTCHVADSTGSASSPIAARRHEFKNQAPINSKESVMEAREHWEAWNKEKLIGQKAPL